MVRHRQLEQASPAWRNYGPIAVVAVLGLILSAMATVNVSQWEKQEAENAFREASRDRVLVVQREIEHTFAVVRDVASLFESYRNVSRREFRHFVGPALKRLAGIQSLEWVPRISAEDRADFVRNAQHSFPRFQITEPDSQNELVSAGPRSFYFPVLYVQPYKLNKEKLGLDLGANPEMLEKFEHASGAGSTLTVFTIDSGRKGAARPGLVAYLPVFRGAESQDDDAEEYEDQVDTLVGGSQELLGYAIGRFRIGQIVERALRNLSPSGIDLRFFAKDDSGERKLLYTHLSRLRPRRS